MSEEALDPPSQAVEGESFALGEAIATHRHMGIPSVLDPLRSEEHLLPEHGPTDRRKFFPAPVVAMFVHRNSVDKGVLFNPRHVGHSLAVEPTEPLERDGGLFVKILLKSPDIKVVCNN